MKALNRLRVLGANEPPGPNDCVGFKDPQRAALPRGLRKGVLAVALRVDPERVGLDPPSFLGLLLKADLGDVYRA